MLASPTMTQAAPPDAEKPVQMNVRVPTSLRTALDARRADKGLSRDKWIARALAWVLALDHDPPEVPRRAEDDPLVQMNVRVPTALREQVDARRAALGLSRDRYVTRAAAHALHQHVRGEPHSNRVGRTAPPPRYRNQ